MNSDRPIELLNDDIQNRLSDIEKNMITYFYRDYNSPLDKFCNMLRESRQLKKTYIAPSEYLKLLLDDNYHDMADIEQEVYNLFGLSWDNLDSMVGIILSYIDNKNNYIIDTKRINDNNTVELYFYKNDADYLFDTDYQLLTLEIKDNTIINIR